MRGPEPFKLFRSVGYPMDWFAFSVKEQWVRFPAELGGWERRHPVARSDAVLIKLCQLPLSMGFNTGIPGAPCWLTSTAASSPSQALAAVGSRKGAPDPSRPMLEMTPVAEMAPVRRAAKRGCAACRNMRPRRCDVVRTIP